ncbi:MAG: glycosyltransferase family 4 protein, partial [Thermoleophilaceae bacterium]
MAKPLLHVHLFEPSGYAGVFQHTCRLAELLAEAGHRVVLHTGHEHERLHPKRVEVCRCSWWPRDGARGPRRSVQIGGRLVTRTLPHLWRACQPGAVLHVQGIAAGGPLTALTLAVGRLRGLRTVYSPHDAFSRRGTLDGAILRLAARLPHAVVVHSQADVEELGRRGIAAWKSPLVQVVPEAGADSRRRWREAWRATNGEQVVLFAGWIRPEKRLDLLIECARSWPPERRLAVVGVDRGAWPACEALARSYGLDVSVRLGFLPLEEFTAALSAADLVVAPHQVASQSGVLEVARQLGVPTVAANVGGLSEIASRSFAVNDPVSLNRAIDAQLSNGERPAPVLDEEGALDAHLGAYG